MRKSFTLAAAGCVNAAIVHAQRKKLTCIPKPKKPRVMLSEIVAMKRAYSWPTSGMTATSQNTSEFPTPGNTLH